jgi:DNA-binding LacI/PurR family transcriptional regulator
MAKTIYDVAREARVSISTVSRVINNQAYVSAETREKVLNAMQGYHPSEVAQGLVTKKTMTLGVIISQDPDYFFSNSNYTKVLRGIGVMAKQRNYRILLDVNDSETDYSTLYRGRKVDGLILISVRTRCKYISKLVDNKIPFVLIGDYPDGNGKVPKVEIDDKMAAVQAVTHLLLLGHTKIGLIGGPLNYASGVNRLEGYQAALESQGIGYRQSYVEVVKYVSEEAGHQAAKALLMTGDRPTAIFAFNDTIALGVYQAAEELGLAIPGDLSVIGFDDSEVAKYLNPPLTTVWQPAYEKGLKAAEILINALNRKAKIEEESASLLLPGKLLIRGSCASPR